MTNRARVRAGRARGRAWRAFKAALFTGTAEPVPPRHPSSPIATSRRRNLPLLGEADVVVVLDLALAVVMGLASLVMLVLRGVPQGSEVFLLPLYSGMLPVLLRDRSPVAAWRLCLVAFPIGRISPPPDTIGTVNTLTYVALALCLYAVAVRCERDLTIAAAVLTVLTTIMWSPDDGPLEKLALWTPDEMLLGVIVPLLAALLGSNVRVRRRLSGDTLRAEEAEAAKAALEERSRIARELHDVVAHHMSVIAIQAEAVPLRAAGDARELEAGLKEIRELSLNALSEMRRVLGVLRDEHGERDTAPQPGLDRLGELIANARAAGLTVGVSTPEPLDDLPDSAGLTAYRIVQESLSNAMRHAPGSTVTVAVSRTAGELLLRISNGPPAVPVARIGADDERVGPGHGLIGMRERASMLGGTLAAGPTPDGGFRVSARLPIKEVR
ncbi:Signal transduction histidine kinase [Sinosporangium album]|uniref:histidine kinase n=1 Tax=Sinosporangium album TaxID=504805 RepID=A0A1G8DZG5_9ACTN|nr:sensor histidine kinase [Sinosporangium album]SDH63033.1 Signal transduction histidine kinase [Sinosporangium album]